MRTLEELWCVCFAPDLFKQILNMIPVTYLFVSNFNDLFKEKVSFKNMLSLYCDQIKHIMEMYGLCQGVYLLNQ